MICIFFIQPKIYNQTITILYLDLIFLNLLKKLITIEN